MGNYVVAQAADTDENGMVKTPGTINGGFYDKTEDGMPQAPSVVVSVDDIQAAMKALEANGGKILGVLTPDHQITKEPQMIPGVGLWMSVEDTEGNRFSLLQAKM
jgi:predicted enzyme related to lactoylglutathione lyase